MAQSTSRSSRTSQCRHGRNPSYHRQAVDPPRSRGDSHRNPADADIRLPHPRCRQESHTKYHSRRSPMARQNGIRVCYTVLCASFPAEHRSGNAPDTVRLHEPTRPDPDKSLPSVCGGTVPKARRQDPLRYPEQHILYELQTLNSG